MKSVRQRLFSYKYQSAVVWQIEERSQIEPTLAGDESPREVPTVARQATGDEGRS